MPYENCEEEIIYRKNDVRLESFRSFQFAAFSLRSFSGEMVKRRRTKWKLKFVRVSECHRMYFSSYDWKDRTQ